MLSTKACGSYALIHEKDQLTEIVTAPGFEGLYVDTCTGFYDIELGNIINQRNDLELNKHGLASVLGYSANYSYMTPVNTLIDGVRQIKGGQHIKLNKKSIVCQYSYLNRLSCNSSFGYRFEEAINSLKGDAVTLLFSGGPDSTALYLALREKYDEEDINVVVVDRYPSWNRYDIPCQVSKDLGFELDLIKHPFYETDNENFIDSISKIMGKRLIKPSSPYHALKSKQMEDNIIAGHNIDAMLCIGMPKAPKQKIQTKAHSVEDHSYFVAYMGYLLEYINSNILPGFHYSKFFANNKYGREVYLNTVPPLFKYLNLNKITNGKISRSPIIDTAGVADKSDSSVLASLLTGTIPPTLSPAEGLSVNDVKQELQELRNWWSDWTVTVAEELPLIRYYQYAHNANKTKSAPNIHGKSLKMPSMWGPLVPNFLAPMTFKDVMRPKYNIFDYIENKSGKSYDSIISDTRESNVDLKKSNTEWGESPLSKFVERNNQAVSSENSLVKQLSPTKQLTRKVKQIQDKYDSDSPLSRGELEMAIRLINIDKLLYENY